MGYRDQTRPSRGKIIIVRRAMLRTATFCSLLFEFLFCWFAFCGEPVHSAERWGEEG